jgi:hypothetical protein
MGVCLERLSFWLLVKVTLHKWVLKVNAEALFVVYLQVDTEYLYSFRTFI